jgi:hypothetical protein
MVMCDVTCQLAHREGFGLPNLESQACKVPPMVIDWCSGSEIAGGGKGLLVRRIDYMSRGTWGGAKDAFPDMPDALRKMEAVYANRDELSRIATTGYEWAVQQTWDKAADAVEAELKRVISEQRKERANEPTAAYTIPAPGLSDTYGPAHSEYRSADLQQPPGGDALPRIAGHDNGSEPDAGDSERRLLDRLQSYGAAPSAGDSQLENAA